MSVSHDASPRVGAGIFRRCLVVAGVVLVSGCSSGASDSSSTSRPAEITCKDATDGAITVVTKQFDFDPSCIDVAGTTLDVTYDNQEPGVLHNFRLKGAVPKGAAATKLTAGPNRQDVSYVKLTPGTYSFICDIHPTMAGKVVVTAESP